MILVDTSVWVDHLRGEDRELTRLLDEGRLLMHAYVIGELAVGSMRNWSTTVLTLLTLPRIPVRPIDNVVMLLRRARLQGSGLGFVDVALLSAALARRDTQLWARDKRLARSARSFGIAYASD